MESEFPSNSNKNNSEKPEPEPKKVERIISGNVVRRKKPLGKRIAETFTGGNPKGVWSVVMMDVLLPGAKNIMYDVVSQGFERMIFGEGRSSNGRRSGYRSGGSNVYTNYGNRYSQNTPRDRDYRDEPRHNMSRKARSTHDFDEIILPTRAEANEVIDRLFELISRYDVAKVSDLYELIGVTGNYTDERYGWTDIRGSDATRVRNGYLLDLPKPELLD